MEEYTVSAQGQARMERLLALPAVRQGLEFLREDQERSIQEQMEITCVEAPTFFEESRARLFFDKLRALGVENLSIGERFNVTGVIPGEEPGEILLEAHLDTVFPFGTVQEVRRENGVLYAPGVYDNARGIASLLAVLRALQHTGVRPRRTIIVAGTTREEGLGSAEGMRELLLAHPAPAASLSVDGGFIDGISYKGNFSQTSEFTFHGKGGHAGNGFGLFANPLGAAARAVALLSELVVPESPRTTFAATKMLANEDGGVGSIPGSCRLCVNFRSEEEAMFDWLEREILRCMEEGCRLETARWNADVITVTQKRLTGFPGGMQDVHAPLVEAHYLAARAVGGDPFFRAGSSNANIAISMGIPAVTVGAGRGNRKGHSLNEFFPEENAYRCPQGLFLLLLLAAGVQGSIEPCV